MRRPFKTVTQSDASEKKAGQCWVLGDGVGACDGMKGCWEALSPGWQGR